jgi:hypothetical protein
MNSFNVNLTYAFFNFPLSQTTNFVNKTKMRDCHEI